MYPAKQFYRTGAVVGAVHYTYVHSHGAGVETRRYYRLIRTGRRQWEIAIKDFDVRDYVTSSGETPEGAFPSIKEAEDALRSFLGVPR